MKGNIAAQMVTVPIAKAISPATGLHMVYVDHWWPVSDDECVYRFGPTGSAQCNASKMVVEKLVGDGSGYPRFKEIRQLPFVSFRINPSDYV